MVKKLEVVAGSMFAGKTDELIRLIERSEYAGKSVLVFKPDIDDRWGKKDKIASHSGAEHEATPVDIHTPEEILELVDAQTDMVGIDEVQFFDPQIVDVVDALLDADIEVVVSGLPLDFRGEPFGQMPTLLAKADKIRRLTAICTYENHHICGKKATRTQRFVNGQPAQYTDPIILVGAEESYAPRCPKHHIVPSKPEKIEFKPKKHKEKPTQIFTSTSSSDKAAK